MKRICFVTTIYLTYRSFLKQFSIYLYETGEYDISLICNEEDEIKNDLPSFVHYYPVHMERGVSLSAFSAIREIRDILKQQKFNIVQYSTPNAAFYTSIAAKQAKMPVRLYCQWGIRYMGLEGIKRSIFKLFEKITCDNSTAIEVESHNIRQFSLGEGLYKQEKSSVIWNGSACGVDLTRFDVESRDDWRQQVREELGLGKNDFVYAFAARLTADKGINELLEAFRSLADSKKDAKLLVMGGMDDSGSLNQELYLWAQQSDQVILTGNVNDIERYYAASDVFVSPSYREGFGLVVIEAEAMALPAIVSNVPGQIDAILENETGITCDVKNAVSLKNAMVKLYCDRILCKRFGANAANYVKMYYEQKKLFDYLKKHRDELNEAARTRK